jgi:hypothetical protein
MSDNAVRKHLTMGEDHMNSTHMDRRPADGSGLLEAQRGFISVGLGLALAIMFGATGTIVATAPDSDKDSEEVAGHGLELTSYVTSGEPDIVPYDFPSEYADD